MLCFYEELNIK